MDVDPSREITGEEFADWDFPPKWTAAEMEGATQWLLDHTDTASLHRLYQTVQSEGASWRSRYHFMFGMNVRNALTIGGFAVRGINLDSCWHLPMAEAARRHVELEQPAGAALTTDATEYQS